MRRNILNAALVVGLAWAVAPQARAQNNSSNPECLGTDCGSPNQEGGGCSCSCGCSVWVSYTDQGKTLSYTDDTDGDGVPDYADNCWLVANPDQKDVDGDGIGDKCDNCPTIPNVDQKDTNGNGIGDVCDADLDGDGIPDKHTDLTPATAAEIASGAYDNCAYIPNHDQAITCLAGNANCNGYVATLGDACNSDIDGDQVPNVSDTCPLFANVDQTARPATPALVAQLCTGVDTDKDGVPDFRDNCPTVPNADQKVTLPGGILGDVCNPDIDGDGIPDKNQDLSPITPAQVAAGSLLDNCPFVPNHDQLDSTNSGIGDACKTSYCFVVDRNSPSDCLDPKQAFMVNAGVEFSMKAGETLIPAVWANRKGEAINYTWTVVTAPPGSQSVVSNAKGVVTVSQLWAYQYVAGEEPKFVPDMNGTYTLQLNASLVYPDRANPQVSTSTAQLTITVSDNPQVTRSAPGVVTQSTSSGCGGASTATGTAASLAPLLGLALALAARRRRS